MISTLSDGMMKQVLEKCETLGVEYVGIQRIGKNDHVVYICPAHREVGEQHAATSHFIRKKRSCPLCQGRVRNLDDFIAKMKKLGLNNEIEISGEYTGDLGFLHVRCLECGHEWDSPAHNIKASRSCPRCAIKLAHDKCRKSQKQFEKDVEKVAPHITVIGKYQNSHTLVRFRCKLDNCEWQSHPANILNGSAGCPSCRNTSNECRIRTWLQSMGLQVYSQYRIKECRYKLPLAFDIFVPEYNLMIEYDGEQHYYLVPFKGMNEDEFRRTQERDAIKNRYCLEHNIPLIRVPYWEKDNFQSYIISQMALLGLPPLPQQSFDI